MRIHVLVVACLLGCGEVRREHQTFATNCAGGINQQFEKATFEQCADARNVWAPNGKVEQRPGYVGIVKQEGSGSSTDILYARLEDVSAGPPTTFTSPSGAGVLTLNNAPAMAGAEPGDRIYLGYASTFEAVQIVVPAANSNSTRIKMEYWNGTEWSYLDHGLFSTSQRTLDDYICDTDVGSQILTFPAPQDWATTSVDSQSAYWVRLHLRGTDIDAACSIDVDNGSTGFITDVSTKSLFVGYYPTSKFYLRVAKEVSNYNYTYSASLQGHGKVWWTNHTPKAVDDQPATIAVVPQFAEVFVAYNHVVTRFYEGITSSASIVAAVESNAAYVGSGAPYATDYIAQLSSWPQSKYISFFNGRLWAANLSDNPFAVRWSAAAPYHKVWPQLSIEVLAEHDNSPITGMAPLGEYMTIFKSDSIWMAYPTEIDSFGLQTYAIRQVVAGVGCVSNSSIRAVRGNLIFLAEDGIYRFDGANVEKLSDPLNDTIASITPGRRPFSAAAHWRSKSLYLLSVTTDGSNTSNLTIVYDYKNGSWWLWDNIDAQHWLEDEAPNDNEELYFGDSSGRIYQMGVGRTDHGGTIESYVTTQRLGYGSGTKMRLRSIEAWCSNKTREVDVDVYRNDELVTPGASGTISFTDSNEADWDDFNYSHAYGSITPVAGASLVDGETFTLNDGTNTASVFEFDSNGSVTAGRVTVTFTGGDSASTVRDSIVSAINGASNLNITATAGPGDYVRLDHDSNTTSGNQTITETVANSSFVVAGMTGAQGSDKDNWSPMRRRVRRIDTREDFDWVQAKISHDQKNQKFELSRLAFNVVGLGNR